MSKCRKCNKLKNSREIEAFLVHLWEGHGLSINDAKEIMDLKNEEIDSRKLEEMIKAHKKTGEAGSGMFKTKI